MKRAALPFDLAATCIALKRSFLTIEATRLQQRLETAMPTVHVTHTVDSWPGVACEPACSVTLYAPPPPPSVCYCNILMRVIVTS